MRDLPWSAKAGGIVLAAILGLGVIGALAGAPEEDPGRTEAAGASRSTTTEARTTTQRPTTTTTTRPVTTTVPPPPPTTLPPPPPTTAPPPPEPVPVPAPEPEPDPAPGGGCHPSYDPCVPIASDVDCQGGSGNGPEYVSGPIHVHGPDEYGLDADGDGIGCE